VHETCLSTMWSVGRFESMADFFPAAWRLGFHAFEINHQVDSAMLAGLDPRRYPIPSVHEPCPADIPTATLMARNWLISSPDEDGRRQGVQAVQRSIDLASALGARLVVVHPGKVDIDTELEAELLQSLATGQGASPRHAELQARLVAARAARADANLDAVRRSLAELADYAGRAGVRLGLENRDHYYEIPLPEEMAWLLEQLDEERVGFWYDVGHAEILARLGFGHRETWLERFGSRTFGVHLHDVRGFDDHLAAGLGELDWAAIAAQLPAGVQRTCEFRSFHTPEQVAAALQLLAAQGCLAQSRQTGGSPCQSQGRP